jgi:rRNA maturation protein Nop10
METGESGATALTAAATDPVVLKRNSDDVEWKYGVLVNPVNKEKV